MNRLKISWWVVLVFFCSDAKNVSLEDGPFLAATPHICIRLALSAQNEVNPCQLSRADN